MCSREHYSALLSLTATKGNSNEEKRYSVDRLVGNVCKWWGVGGTLHDFSNFCPALPQFWDLGIEYLVILVPGI